MKRLKIILVLLCCFLLLTGFTPPNTLSSDEYETYLKEYVDNGYVIEEIGENYAVLGKVVNNDLSLSQMSVSESDNNYTPNIAWGWSISYPQLVGYTHYPDRPIRSDLLVGGGSTSLSISHTEATTISYGLEVGGSIRPIDVNIKLGFSKTSSITRTDTVSYNCDVKYRNCEITIYPRMGIYTYNIYQSNTYRGKGGAHAFIGYYQSLRVQW